MQTSRTASYLSAARAVAAENRSYLANVAVASGFDALVWPSEAWLPQRLAARLPSSPSARSFRARRLTQSSQTTEVIHTAVISQVDIGSTGRQASSKQSLSADRLGRERQPRQAQAGRTVKGIGDRRRGRPDRAFNDHRRRRKDLNAWPRLGITSDGVFGVPTPLRPDASAQRLLEMAAGGELGPDVTLIHGTGFPEEVMEALKDHGVCLVLAATSDSTLRGLGNSVPPIQQAIDHGMLERTGISMQADLVVIRATDINLGPLNNAVGTVIVGAGVDNVHGVIIGGRLKKWNGRLLRLGESAILRAATASRDYLAASMGLWKQKTSLVKACRNKLMTWVLIRSPISPPCRRRRDGHFTDRNCKLRSIGFVEK